MLLPSNPLYINKFYFHDALTPNSGTMPDTGTAFATSAGGGDTTGDASGARTPRDATHIIGTNSPDIESVVTANANQTLQVWGHRRFVTRPLAAFVFDNTMIWSCAYARSESNSAHNQRIITTVYGWRPSTGAVIAAGLFQPLGSEPTSAGAEQVETLTGSSNSGSIQNGDILVFEFSTSFTQSMSTAYTENFAYDGSIEGSTTTCASFISFSTPLQVYAYQQGPAQAAMQAVKRSAYYMLGGLWRPEPKKLWLPPKKELVLC